MWGRCRRSDGRRREPSRRRALPVARPSRRLRDASDPAPWPHAPPTLWPMTESSLLLLRHGFSEWNEKGLFTGWVDVRLTETGIAEGRRAGELIREQGLLPDHVYTSVLTRAIQTADEALLV